MVAGHTLALMGWYVVISGDMGNALTFFFIFLCMAFAAGLCPAVVCPAVPGERGRFRGGLGCWI